MVHIFSVLCRECEIRFLLMFRNLDDERGSDWGLAYPSKEDRVKLELDSIDEVFAGSE